MKVSRGCRMPPSPKGTFLLFSSRLAACGLRQTLPAGLARTWQREGLLQLSFHLQGSVRKMQGSQLTSYENGQRICRRLRLLRGLSKDKQNNEPVFRLSLRPCGADGSGA